MKTIHFTILIIFAVLLASCKKPKEEYWYLTDTARQMAPYQIEDTVYFLDESGQRRMLITTEIEDSWVGASSDLDIWLQTQIIRLKAPSQDADLVICISASSWISAVLSCDEKRYFGNDVLFNSQTGRFPKYYDSQHLLDSVFINNHLYFDIVIDSLSGFRDAFYYNKSHGVLKIKKEDKIVFTLDTVIFADKR